MSDLAEYLNLDMFSDQGVHQSYNEYVEELSSPEERDSKEWIQKNWLMYEDFLDDMAELISLTRNLDYYSVGSLGGQGTPGVDINIKLDNMNLGEGAENYNPDHDDAFGEHLMQAYFPDQLEYAMEHLSEEFGVSSDISGRSGGHLVLTPDGMEPFSDSEVNDFETMEGSVSDYLAEAQKLTDAVAWVEDTMKGLKAPGFLDEEREYFETENFQSFDESEHTPELEEDDDYWPADDDYND